MGEAVHLSEFPDPQAFGPQKEDLSKGSLEAIDMDRYGVSWQLILSDPEGEDRPVIVPSLMFVGPNAGRAEEAIRFHTSVFRNARRGLVARYGKGQEPDKEGTIMFADFVIEAQWFAAMDSARHRQGEAASFVSVICRACSGGRFVGLFCPAGAERRSEDGCLGIRSRTLHTCCGLRHVARGA